MRILFVSFILVLTDQLSKFVVRKTMLLYESIPVIPDFFHLTYVTNDGMAFGINFPFGIYIFSTISIIFVCILFYILIGGSFEGSINIDTITNKSESSSQYTNLNQIPLGKRFIGFFLATLIHDGH